MIWNRLRALPPLWGEAGLVVLVISVQLWPFLARVSLSGRPWHWTGYAAVVLAALPLLWRRRAPLAALLAGLLAAVGYDLTPDVPAQPVWYANLVAAYTVAARAGRRSRVVALVLTLGGGFATSSVETALRGGVLFVAAYAIGRAAAAHRERTAWLEHDRRVAAERAAERERARIARDMHDILSHAVSVMVVQAEAGPVFLDRDRVRAAAAFEAIAGAGRDAMVQLRRILHVLRAEDGGLAPQPTLADLPALVGQVPSAAFTVSGTPVPVPADVEVAVYRITQEALTNVVRHARAQHTDVRLGWHAAGLAVEVTDDGRGAGHSPAGSGLIGIGERAAACGGSASAGPGPGGRGFRVRAEFPA